MKLCISHSGKNTTENVWEYSVEVRIVLVSVKEK
jgi:hypothetical protein